MDLDDLLSDIDGIGSEPHSAPAPVTATATAEVARPQRSAVGELPSVAKPEPAIPAATREPSVAARVLDEDAPALDYPPAPSLNLILDVELDVQVELGKLRIPLKHLMAIKPGDSFALDGRADTPLKIFVNEQMVAYGEPLVVDGSLAVRIVELLATGTEG